jgi:hypothetical protein
MNVISRLFSRLSIGGLLAVGFSLLGGLTAVLAVVAVLSLQAVLTGESRLRSIADIHAGILGVRVSEKDYRLSGKEGLERVVRVQQDSEQARAHSFSANAALVRVTEDVSHIHVMNLQVAAATEAQSRMSGGVSHSMERVREAAERGRERSDQLLFASRELTQLAEQMRVALRHFVL